MELTLPEEFSLSEVQGLDLDLHRISNDDLGVGFGWR